MGRLPYVLALVVALLLPSAVHAQSSNDEWVAQVRRLLQQYGKEMETRGYSMSHQIYTGSLNKGQSEMVSLDLDIGTLYQIMGACDTDCDDLDFVLYDSSGNQVDSDLEEDDYPVVSVEPRRSATYRVKVIMASCSAEPCRYGIAVFGK